VVVDLEFERCYAAVVAKEARFDGYFFTAVTSTGIYCRPSCPARTPKPSHLQFHRTAASAQQAGFRACKRCRPDAAPGSSEWRVRSDTAARAMRLISDGVMDRNGVSALAHHLGYSARQVQRICVNELGAEPVALARAQRAHSARILIETTTMPMSDVAFAAGFSSIRQFNDTVRDIYANTPSELRVKAGSQREATSTGLVRLRLAYREPFHAAGVFGHLVATAVPGIEQWHDGQYERTISLHHGAGIASLRPAKGYIQCDLELDDLRDLTTAVSRCRALLDLDADPVAIDSALENDAALRPLVTRAPGRRIPGTVDGNEWVIRVLLGQQISTRAAQNLTARLSVALGDELTTPRDGLTHLFPSAARIAEAPDHLLAMPDRRRRCIRHVASLLASGELDVGLGADRDLVREQLRAIAGIGPWSIDQITMRALGDPDALCASDLGVLGAARQLLLARTVRELEKRSEPWRPWRSYVVQYLWASGEHAINDFERNNTIANSQEKK
jgi:AraC family transcriptional regulator of adaptative response / DNA-3-methyladenine glycosylase II